MIINKVIRILLGLIALICWIIVLFIRKVIQWIELGFMALTAYTLPDLPKTFKNHTK